MSNSKKAIREAFRLAVFKREKGKCRKCGALAVDAHHITDRREMPNGGYVLENGIALCAKCHELAEVFHSTGVPHPGMAPADLYAMVGSTHERAVRASHEL